MSGGFPGGDGDLHQPANTGGIGDAVLIPGSRRSREEGIATHSSILAWRIPEIDKLGRLQSMESVRHN